MTKKRRTWECEECNDPLPKKGFVWSFRFKKWKESKRETSGFYCDCCVSNREY